MTEQDRKIQRAVLWNIVKGYLNSILELSVYGDNDKHEELKKEIEKFIKKVDEEELIY